MGVDEDHGQVSDLLHFLAQRADSHAAVDQQRFFLTQDQILLKANRRGGDVINSISQIFAGNFLLHGRSHRTLFFHVIGSFLLQVLLYVVAFFLGNEGGVFQFFIVHLAFG